MPHVVNVPTAKKILIVRTDRIGDVVLSLPMIPILKSALPKSSISFLLRSYTRELTNGQRGIDSILLYDEDGIEKPLRQMLAQIKSLSFDTVVVTYPTFRLAILMFLSRIPFRIGTGYRWYSFLFNMKVYEHRKTAERHEAEYNISLLRPLGAVVSGPPEPRLVLTNKDRDEAEMVLKEIRVDAVRPIVILHPGSGGSARDWPPERFGQLAALLVAEGMQVVVSKGPSEDKLAQSVLAHSDSTAKILPRALPLMSLAALIERAQVFVSNSTGPLHVAAAVGTPVVAFYPPIRQCSSSRWGPLTGNKVIFEPSSADCPRCKGGACQANECLKTINAGEVAAAVRTLAHRKSHVGAVAGR
ncbi:MAG TPA: glycosyltransferase family 9 protein [Bacteroidota bacterium]